MIKLIKSFFKSDKDKIATRIIKLANYAGKKNYTVLFGALLELASELMDEDE